MATATGFATAPGHVCAKGAAQPQPKGKGPLPGGTAAPVALGGMRSNAKKTTCGAGHRHASKMEARVCDRLTGEYEGSRPFKLVQQIRLPLLCLAEWNGTVKYLTIDFAVIDTEHLKTPLHRLIDAKHPKRVSRDWPARKRACELSWGLAIEEVSA